jgi:hypothetical protein
MEKAENIYRAQDKKFIWYDIYTWKDGCVVFVFIIIISCRYRHAIIASAAHMIAVYFNNRLRHRPFVAGEL